MKKPTIEEYEEFKRRQDEVYKRGGELGLIKPYDKELVDKLSDYYYKGIPLSITLLSSLMAHGRCHELTMQLARVFVDNGDRVLVVRAVVDSLRTNPDMYDENDPEYADHSFVFVEKKDGVRLIYDTNLQLVFDADLYLKMERPYMTGYFLPDGIKGVTDDLKENYPEDYKLDKESAMAIIPIVEESYMLPSEWASINSYYDPRDGGLLGKEVEYLKRRIGYNRELKKQRKAKNK